MFHLQLSDRSLATGRPTNYAWTTRRSTPQWWRGSPIAYQSLPRPVSVRQCRISSATRWVSRARLRREPGCRFGVASRVPHSRRTR